MAPRSHRCRSTASRGRVTVSSTSTNKGSYCKCFLARGKIPLAISPRGKACFYTHTRSLSLYIYISIAISAGETGARASSAGSLLSLSLSLNILSKYIYILIFGSAPPKKDIYRYIIDWDVIISCGIGWAKIQQETCAYTYMYNILHICYLYIFDGQNSSSL